MNDHVDFFNRMTKEAIEELASGKCGWKEVTPNTLILACFGMLSSQLSSKLTKPLWLFAGSVTSGITWLVVR